MVGSSASAGAPPACPISPSMSPDGRYVFCGGWSGYGWDKTHSVYIFERETGRLIRRLTGLPSVINHLAVSKDGAYLAAVLGEDGLRVWRLSDLTMKVSEGIGQFVSRLLYTIKSEAAHWQKVNAADLESLRREKAVAEAELRHRLESMAVSCARKAGAASDNCVTSLHLTTKGRPIATRPPRGRA